MGNSSSSVARKIGMAANAFERRRTGHKPTSVTVVLTGGTVLVTLKDALSPAEKAVAKSQAGAARVQELHRLLFANSADTLRQEIHRITGCQVREASAELETTPGEATEFLTGTVVQVFLLDDRVPYETWSGTVAGDGL